MPNNRKRNAAKAPEVKEAPLVQLTRHQPNTLVALDAEGSTHITLDLCFANPNAEKSGDKYVTKSMAREKDEEAQTVLDRIRLLFQPAKPKGGSATNSKKKGARPSKEDLLAACPPIRVLGDPSLAEGQKVPVADKGEDSYVVLDTSLPQSVFWKCAKVLYLGDLRNTVRYNIPTITSLVPPTAPFVGVPTVCSNVTTLFTAAHELAHEWGLRNDDGTVTVLSREPVFTATEDLLGRSIVLRLAADAASGLWAEMDLAPVKRTPPPVKRWEQTRTFLAAPDLRVVSYNILYEDFCTGKPFCRNRIYPFASDEVLDIENRKVRILQELLAYHADLIGLQECGKKLFREYLLLSMRSQGYDGIYANKNGSVQEGCGLLFRTERFELVDSYSFPLNWATLEKEHAAIASDIATSHPALKEALENITSIGFVVTLREKASGKKIIVGNTHLFYHANACHIRILQTYMLLQAIGTRLRAAAEADGAESPVIICGDCNCTHSTGAYRLFTTGLVEGNHRSWEKGKLFFWGCDRQLGYDEEEAAAMAAPDVKISPSSAISKKAAEDAAAPAGDAPATAAAPAGPRPPLTEYFHQSLYSPLRLTDSYDRMDPSMPWTNFTMTFREVIDYIFFSESSLEVVRTIPIPEEAELAENYALPNAKYPSDHVALISDLRLRS